MSKVALLTCFQDFNPGYSLTQIVLDQARMLKLYGHEVTLMVSAVYNGDGSEFSEYVDHFKKVVPFAHLKDYKHKAELTEDHKKIVLETADMLKAELADQDFCFTHDIVFTGWNMPYALGVQQMSRELPKLRWLHWVHSIPSAFSDWWSIREYGHHHKLIFPNKAERIRVAEQFRGVMNDVRIIPHIKDLRSWFGYHEDTCDFIAQYPGVMQNDVVKVYPASTDRLSAKGVEQVILIMAHIKKMGFSVCLVIANQWATGRQRKEDVARYLKIASRNGLRLHEDFIFTSEWHCEGDERKYALGLPHRILRELMLCANLFIFPTREESFGLVAPEAALSGGQLMVLNKSLSMMMEVHGYNGLYFDFGSFHNTFNPQDEVRYFEDVAKIIVGRMRENEIIGHRSFIRQNYNWDTLYLKHYQPIMAEAITWA